MESTPNSQTPLVSVLCVSRNQDRNLRRCLVALSRSTLAARTQVVVVDLASRDETAAVVVDFPELTALRLPKNFGWTKAANIGLRSTTAENILFLDPCVELDPGTVEVLLSSVEESGAVAAAVATLRTADGSPASYLRPLPDATLVRTEAHAPARPEESESVDYPGLAALLIRKSFLKGMNYFDERYGELWADAELAAQVKRAQRRILRLPEAGGVLHAEQDKRIPSALLAADWHSGAGVYLKKHYGVSLGRSLGPIVGSLLSGNLSLARHLLAGDKVDGTQE